MTKKTTHIWSVTLSGWSEKLWITTANHDIGRAAKRAAAFILGSVLYHGKKDTIHRVPRDH